MAVFKQGPVPQRWRHGEPSGQYTGGRGRRQSQGQEDRKTIRTQHQNRPLQHNISFDNKNVKIKREKT